MPLGVPNSIFFGVAENVGSMPLVLPTLSNAQKAYHLIKGPSRAVKEGVVVRLDKNTRQIMVDVEHTKVPEKYRPPLLRYDEMW